MPVKSPAPPPDLADRGRAYWRVTLDVFEINESDARLLHEACRILDELDELRAVIVAEGVTSEGSQGQPVAHPALAAMSSHRGILGRLVAQLNLPYAEDASTIKSSAHVRASRAAKARWANRGGAA